MPRKTYKKKIVTQETLNGICKTNGILAERFLKHKSLTASDTTIRGYSSDLDIFFSYCYLHLGNKPFVEIKKFDLIEFFSFAMDELKWGSSRMNRMRSALSSLSQFIERVLDDEYPNFRNIVLAAVDSVPRSERREKTVLTDEDVDVVLKHFHVEDPQIACWFALAVFSGMRFSELLRVDVSTIRDAKDAFGGIFLYTSPILSKGRGGKRTDSKYILKNNFLPYFETWVEQRKSRLGEAKQHEALFIRKNGDRATSGTVRSWVRKISSVMGKEFYPHAARHRMTTLMSLKGIPRDLIQAIMGWKSADLVGVYDDSTVQDKEWKELDNLI